jgi:hypothetical protein
MPSSIASRWIGVVLVCLGVAYAIATSHVQMFEPASVAATTPAYNDAMRYIAMVERTGTAPSPYRYRILVPALARLIPDRVISLVSSRKDPTTAWIAAAKLSLLNVLFLAAAGAAIVLLMLVLRFDWNEAMLASLLFYTTRPVVQYGGVPMVEAAAWFFLAAAAASLLAQRYLALALITAIGVLAKETVLLVIPLAVLSPHSRRERFRSLGALVPAALLCVALRVWYLPDASPDAFGAWWNSARAAWLDVTAELWLSPSGFVDLVSSFGPLWVLAVIGYRALPENHVVRGGLWSCRLCSY